MATRTPDAAGTATFPAVFEGGYLVGIEVPPGVVNEGATSVAITVDFGLGPVMIPEGTFRVTQPSTGYPRSGQAGLGFGPGLPRACAPDRVAPRV